MAGSLSDYGENLVLDWICSTGAWADNTIWLALLLADPLDDDSARSEPSDDADYERCPVDPADWAAAAAGSVTTATALTFCAAATDFSTVSHIGLYESSDPGGGSNLLWHADLSTARDVTGGESVNFAAGKITITLT